MSKSFKMKRTLFVIAIVLCIVGCNNKKDLTPFCQDGYFGYKDITSGEVVIEPIYEFAKPFKNNLSFFQQNGKWGVINKEGIIVVKPIYDNIHPFKHGVSVVLEGSLLIFGDDIASEKGMYGLIDSDGNELIDPQYNYIGEFSDGLAIINSDGMCGFIDTMGRIIVEPMYLEVRAFNEGLAAVNKDGQWGFIDKNGRMVIPCIYTSVGDFKNGRAIVRKLNKCGIIGYDGASILAVSDYYIHSELNDFYVFSSLLHESNNVESINVNSGLIDKHGNVIIDDTLKFIGDIQNGYSCGCIDCMPGANGPTGGRWYLIDKCGKISQNDVYEGIGSISNGILNVKKNGKWGAVDLNGRTIIPFDYKYLSAFKHGQAIAIIDSLYGVINLQNEPVIPFVFTRINDYKNMAYLCNVGGQYYANNIVGGNWKCFLYSGRFLNKIEIDANNIGNGLVPYVFNDKMGYVDWNSKIIIPCEFDYVNSFQGTYAIVIKKNKHAIINRKGELQTNFDYTELYRISNNIFSGKKENNFVMINTANSEFQSSLYDNCILMNDGYINASFGGFYGVINSEGIEIVPLIYDYIESNCINGRRLYSENGLYGFFDSRYEEVIMPKFQKAVAFSEGIAFVYNGSKWGAIDRSGNMVLPYLYNSSGSFKNGQCRINIDGQWTLIDRKGVIIE